MSALQSNEVTQPLFREFTIDPGYLKSMPDELLRVLPLLFGYDAGRQLRLSREVWDEAMADKSNGCALSQKKYLAIFKLLQDNKALFNTLDTDTPAGGQSFWPQLDLCHNRRRFDAVLSNRQRFHGLPEDLRLLKLGDCADTGTSSPWYTPACLSIPRTAEEISSVLAPLATHTTKVVFIDPYLLYQLRETQTSDSQVPDQWKSISRTVEKIEATRKSQATLEIQLHSSIHPFLDRKKNITQAEHIIQSESIKHIDEQLRHFEQQLKKLSPSAIVSSFIWKGRPDEDRMHDRYFLTDHWGVGSTGGLDCDAPQGRNTKQKTTIFRLPGDIFQALKTTFPPSDKLLIPRGELRRWIENKRRKSNSES
ncbi:MAG: hypothetical protein ACKOEO_04495 [Planctomycetaceae bacterium]